MEWHAMLVLGAYHGINPGMGWLFAVALGMQRRSARGCGARCRPSRSVTRLAVGVVVLGGRGGGPSSCHRMC